MYSYQYPRPALTADSVILAPDAEGEYRVLLVRRGNDPFKGMWALPGGFMDMDETLEQCARRELKEETGVDAPVRFEELGSFSTVAVIPMAEARGGDDAADAQWFPLNALPPLAFDHEEIMQRAIDRMGLSQ